MRYAAKLKRQFNYLVKTISRGYKNNQWQQYSQRYQAKQLRRLKRLLQAIKGIPLNAHTLKNLGVATLLLIQSDYSFAQLGTAQLNAFGIADATCTGHTLVDLDNDGDLDLFISTPYQQAQYYQNIGTASSPDFSASPTQSLGSFIPHDYSFVDIDNDGDLDLFASKEYGNGPYFYENTGSSSNPIWSTAQLNAFGIADATCTGHALVDLDNDGDLDLFISTPYQQAQYYQNIGTASSPDFSASPTQPLGSFIPHDYSFVDIDNDGDLDLFASKEYGNGPYFYENTGSSSNPIWGAAQLNAFGIADATCTGHGLVDLDNDGDLDLFISTPYQQAQYYQNTGSVSSPDFSTSPTQTLGSFIPHDYSFVDLDNDGDLDLFVSKEYGNGPYFYNNGLLTSTTKLQQSESFSYAPNPVSNMLYIDFEKKQEAVWVSIVTTLGQLTFEQEYRDITHLEIDGKNLPQFCFLKIKTIHSSQTSIPIVKK